MTKSEILPKKKKTKTKKQKVIHRIIWIAAIVIILIFVIRFGLKKAVSSVMGGHTAAAEYTTQEVKTATIENCLSSSGTVQPLDTYSVTTVSSVEGTVISADFEEGDVVNEGDVLYQISTDSMESALSSAKKSVERAEKNYQKSLDDYEKTKKKYEDLTVTAPASGYIKNFTVEKGDNITQNAQVAQIYNNKTMLLKIPFNADDIKSSLVGKKATVELSDTGETLDGKVSAVNTANETLSGNRVVRYVTISVENPGAITADMTATASIGKLYCNEEGTFSASDDKTAISEYSGEVTSVYVKEGSWVDKGDVILRLSSDSADSQIEESLSKTETYLENVEDAKSKLKEVKESLTDYTVTSPITGTIIQKNIKAGDTLSASSMNTTLCLIYDLSAMTFEMYVDELDVHSVETGQVVNITADALSDETFEGVITNVSLVSTTSGGVTQYPVTVRINETKDLLPGMNISGEIVIESAENVLCIPSDSLMRGNVVYVKDSSVTEEIDGAPAGFRSVEVTSGISNDESIEITSGLSEGDIVYVPARASSQNNIMGMPGMSGEMPAEGNRGGGMPDDQGGNRKNGSMSGGGGPSGGH